MVAALLLGACVPMVEMREGAAAEKLRGLVRGFCVAQASGDVTRIAAVFEPKLEAAILQAAKDGTAPAFASLPGAKRCEAGPGAKRCEAGQTWYLGGSRRVMEVRYDGFSDRVDLWLSRPDRLFDLSYGKGGGSLRKRLGMKP
jgi:hypothetical protein